MLSPGDEQEVSSFAERRYRANVDKVGRALITAPESEFLAAQLRGAEDRLRHSRQKLDEVARGYAPSPRAKIDVSLVVAAFRDVAELAKRSPDVGREIPANVVEPIMLRPVPEGGYEAEIALENSTAAIAGGRVGDKSGRGGPMINFLSTADPTDSALIVPIRGRIHPKSIFRGLRGAVLPA